MPFSFGPIAFFGRFNKIYVFIIFPDASGHAEKFFPGRGEAEKLAESEEKKNQAKTSIGTIFMTKTKKTLFHYITLY